MRHRHLITAAAGAAVLAATALAVQVRTGTAEARPHVASPPAVDRGGAFVAVDPPAARTGGSLTFTVRNPASAPFRYGVDTTIDRWDGAAWHPAYRAGAALAGAGGAGQGRLVAPGEDLAVIAIGLQADPGGSGPGEALPLRGVAPGWYRIGVTSVVPGSQAPGLPASAGAHAGAVAYGTFQVLPG